VQPAAPSTPAPLNPLAEASPQSLGALFSADPLGLSKTDLAVIVSELRKQRLRWAAAEASGATRAPRAPKSTPAKVNASSVQSLDDLGL
jgi:hypothetical protein